jgi:hypothetical protein
LTGLGSTATAKLYALRALSRRRKGLTSQPGVNMIMPPFIHRRRLPAKSLYAWLQLIQMSEADGLKPAGIIREGVK